MYLSGSNGSKQHSTPLREASASCLFDQVQLARYARSTLLEATAMIRPYRTLLNKLSQGGFVISKAKFDPRQAGRDLTRSRPTSLTFPNLQNKQWIIVDLQFASLAWLEGGLCWSVTSSQAICTSPPSELDLRLLYLFFSRHGPTLSFAYM